MFSSPEVKTATRFLMRCVCSPPNLSAVANDLGGVANRTSLSARGAAGCTVTTKLTQQPVRRRASDPACDGPDRSDRDENTPIGNESTKPDVQMGTSSAKTIRASGHISLHNRPDRSSASCFLTLLVACDPGGAHIGRSLGGPLAPSLTACSGWQMISLQIEVAEQLDRPVDERSHRRREKAVMGVEK